MDVEDEAEIGPEFTRALALAGRGDRRAAAEILERLAAKFPHRPAILGVLGSVRLGLGEYERALECYRETAALCPAFDLASLGLFHSLWGLGRREEAFAEMRRFQSVASSEEYDRLREALRAELIN